MKQKVASLPQKVIQSVQIKKEKFHDQQSMCLYGRERRHDIYVYWLFVLPLEPIHNSVSYLFSSAYTCQESTCENLFV